MNTPGASEALRDFPPVVYVPCDKSDGNVPGPDGQLPVDIRLRRTRDGRIALLAYSALDRFHAMVGRGTDWALLTHDGLDELYARQPFDLLLMDVEIPEESREDGTWLAS